MKNFIFILLSFLCVSVSARETIYKDAKADQKIKGTLLLRYTDQSSIPNYIQFANTAAPKIERLRDWLANNLALNSNYGLLELNRSKDQLQMEHIRYQETFKGIPIQGSMYIAHTLHGMVQSIGGVFYNDIPTLKTKASLTETQALQIALNKVHASSYKWQIEEEENALKLELKNPKATYFPNAVTCILKSNGMYHICYAFNIYAQEPMSRTMEYVDVTSGQIILSKNLIETVNTTGTAITKFSGTQLLQTDSTSPTNFRLRDASRGLGVNTYNLATTSNYGSATDFIDNNNNWNNVNTAHDEAATDAEWGAQRTYDFYFTKYARNSIDNAGYALNSYMHYNTNYVNAFWDGQRMTYGDGNISQGFQVMTALDVCGHEITHGLTNYTCDLSASSTGSDECDALNEAYSDIFATAIEKYSRPTQWDWIIGADITCTSAGVPDGMGIRDMSNPSNMGQPNCYLGTNWDTNGEPHNNNGPCIYWFYLLSTGNAANNITALGIDTATNISFRTLTVHLFPSATYADARFYSIVSSTELYGGCSTPTIATTNAWSTVCVGSPYVASPTVSNFSGDIIQTCDTTLTVNFANTSTNGNTFTWYFGDGTSSTQYNPSHTYSSGVYTVKLVVNGGTCGMDSLTQTSYIHVGPPAGPITTGAILCTAGSATISAIPTYAGDTVHWYNSATGGVSFAAGTNFTTPILSSTTTYYAEEVVTAPQYHIGPLNNTIGSGANYTNTTRFMVFDCSSPTTLKSVWVMASTSGNRTIILKDAAGTLLNSITVNIPSGGSVVTLNLPIPVGTGLQIGLASTSTVNLYRNSTGAVYPYSNGPISITGNTATGSATYYYFFYDWVVQADNCYSLRTPTTVTVGASGSTPATITPNNGTLSACAPNTITLNANTGTGLTYQWYNGSTAISGATSSSYTANTSGNYSVVVTSGLGCLAPGTSAPAAVIINAQPNASITASGATSFCAGGSVLLNANIGSGLNYQWYLNGTAISGATNSTYTATQTGNFSVQVNNASNCSATSSSTSVNATALPTASISATGATTFCQGANVTLNAPSGTGLSYQWYLNGTAISGATSLSYVAAQAGNYTVLVTNSTNCSATSSATTIVVNTSPTASITTTGATTFCAGSSIILNANTGTGFTYQWYLNGSPISGATSSTYSATQLGNYSVKVTNSTTCSTTSSNTLVTVNPAPSTTITPNGPTTFCAGSNVILNSPTGSNLSYQWYLNGSAITGATLNSYTATSAGNYSVQVTNSATTCNASSTTTTVTINPIPTPTITNSGGTLSVSGGPYTSYQWYLNGSPIAGATNATYTIAQGGDYTVLVSLNGCDATSPVVKVIPEGLFDVSGTNSITISPNPTNGILKIEGIKPYKIRIRNMQGAIVMECMSKSEITIESLANGMYMIQLFDRNNAMLLNKKIIKK